MSRILVIEDEPIIRKQLARLLERNQYFVQGVATVEEAQQANCEAFDLILADIRLPGVAGTEIIRQAEQVPVIIMTSYASVRSAVETMKLGAVDYISKPFDHDELLLMIKRSLRELQLSSQNVALRNDLRRIFPHHEVGSDNPAFATLVDQLQQLPESQRFIYLHGERGSGKELLARLTHDSGQRTRGPLVFADLPDYEPASLDDVLLGCERSAITANQGPGGLLHEARSGTLVLRSPERLSLSVQQALVIALGQAPGRNTVQVALDVRVVLLGIDEPDCLLTAGKLQPDFAALFATHSFYVPSLRERREDLPTLAQRYLNQFAGRYRNRRIALSQQAWHAMQAYHWPGNVNELKSALERAVLMVESDEIKPVHLGFALAHDPSVAPVSVDSPMNLSLDGYFRYFVLQYQQSLSETELANKLGMSRKALWERRQKMGLSRQDTLN